MLVRTTWQKTNCLWWVGVADYKRDGDNNCGQRRQWFVCLILDILKEFICKRKQCFIISFLISLQRSKAYFLPLMSHNCFKYYIFFSFQIFHIIFSQCLKFLYRRKHGSILPIFSQYWQFALGRSVAFISNKSTFDIHILNTTFK